MSKIARLEPFSVEYPEPNDNGSLRCLTFAKVTTEDGVEGWGEAITQISGAAQATEVLIKSLAEHIVGEEIRNHVALWYRLRDVAWWYGYRGGLFNFALSAIDIALWDASGREQNLSLVELLGGARVEALPALASTHAFDEDLTYEAERHGDYVRSGKYIGVKVGFGKAGKAKLGYNVARDVKFFASLRTACGPDAWLMVDRGQSLRWTVDEVLDRTRKFEEQGIKWIEEPFEPTQTAELELLRGRASCLIAGGEREWDERGYREVLGSNALDVIGCDVGRVGGITGAQQVVRLVEQHNRWFNSHAWSSAINTAVSLALSATTDRCLLQELKPDEGPMQYELVENPIIASKGKVEIPRGPGIGVCPKQEILAKYRIRD